MLRRISQVLLLLASSAGAMPTNTCILMLAGVCCQECCGVSHTDSDCCDDCANECDGGHHSGGSNSDQHHNSCVTTASDSLVARAQHAPAIDLHNDSVPLLFMMAVMTESADVIAKSAYLESHRYSKPPDLPLYLRLHSFLI